MIKVSSFIMFLSLLVICDMAAAQTATWTGKQTIERVYTSISGRISVRTDPPSAHINPHGCSSKTNYRLYIGESSDYQDRYKLLLTALASGKKISFSLNGCDGTYPAIHSVIMYKD